MAQLDNLLVTVFQIDGLPNLEIIQIGGRLQHFGCLLLGKRGAACFVEPLVWLPPDHKGTRAIGPEKIENANKKRK